MASTGARRTPVRLAAALLASLLVGFAVLTYLSYTAWFSSTDTVTVTAQRAGLVMDRDNKVKYRGIQIGKVKNVRYIDDPACPPATRPCAQLELAIDSGELSYIPANATVHIAGNTIFGAKSVEFIPPKSPSHNTLRPGARIKASDVSLEVNTLFQSLIDLLHKIDPVDLNATVSALAEGLRGHGNDLGALLSGLNTLAEQTNPKLPTLQQDFAKTATVSNIYAAAAPDLVTVFNNVPTIAKIVVDQQGNLN
ncbi:MAG: MCE family protein, partial [Mycobacterium sp.]